MKKFIDSWGWFWEICSSDDEGAVAFGPTGISRPTEYAGSASLRDAHDKGIDIITIVGDDGWEYVTAHSSPESRAAAAAWRRSRRNQRRNRRRQIQHLKVSMGALVAHAHVA